jgi:hypothetical protein
MTPHISKLARIVGIAACGAALAGLQSCYTTGLRFPPSVRNITVQVFGNESYERGIEFQMTEQIREHILEESDVRLVGSSEAADAFIRGKILRVDYPVLVGREQSGILEGSSTIAVEAELVDTRTGRVLARVGGSDLAEFTASLNENRATAVANTIEELAWKVLLGLSERSEGGAIVPSGRAATAPLRR